MSRLRDNVNGGPGAFRTLMEKTFIQIPGVYSGISAILAENAGFPAIYLSGSGVAGMMGLPDLSVTDLGEVALEASRITSISTLPLVVDCDTGFGEQLNVTRTIRMMERAGVAAIHMEDQELPKKCGHLKGKKVVPIDDFIVKLKAATQARKDKDFTIIARTDSRSTDGLDDAIERAREYMNSGADVIFTEALESREEFEEMRRKVKGPLMANMTEFGKSPLLSAKELEDIGYNMVIFPLTAFRGILKTTDNIYRKLKQQGTQKEFIDQMMTRKEYYDVINYDEYESEDYSLSNRMNR